VPRHTRLCESQGTVVAGTPHMYSTLPLFSPPPRNRFDSCLLACGLQRPTRDRLTCDLQRATCDL